MIKITVLKEDNKYKKIILNGHALYDDYGKDIVCSACSSIVTTTINGILRINENGLSYSNSSQGMEIIINSYDDVIQKLIDNMISLLKELEDNYPKNIQIK